MIFLFPLLFEVALLCLLERKMWGTYFTPLNCLSLPYVFATIVAIIYSYSFDSIPDFYSPSLIIWMLGLLFFFIPSILFSSVRKMSRKNFKISVGRKDDNYQLLKVISFVCIAVSLFRVYSTSIHSGMIFGSDEYSEEFQVKGLLAHLSVLISAIFSYIVYKADTRHKSAFLIIILLLINMFAIGVKSWIIAPFLIGYYARVISGKTKFSFKTIVLPILICILIFVLSYYLIMIVSGESKLTDAWFTFIVNHFVDYFSGASLSLSIDYMNSIQEPEMTNALFAPIINFFCVLTGDKYINPINPIFLSIGDLGETNVRTFMGTIWVYSQHPLAFIIIVSLFSIVFYFVFYRSIHSSNIYLLLANCTNLAFLTLGFFDFYWLTFSAYEVFIIFLLAGIFSRCTFNLKYEYKKQPVS
jgi:hypothetical protein